MWMGLLEVLGETIDDNCGSLGTTVTGDSTPDTLLLVVAAMVLTLLSINLGNGHKGDNEGNEFGGEHTLGVVVGPR